MIKYNNTNFKTIGEMLSFYHISKDNIKSLINNKVIKVNDIEVNNLDFDIKKDDLILIDESVVKKSKYIPWNKKLKILYEDDDIVIVYKEPFMLVHPDGNTNETLINALAYYYKDTDVIFEHLHRLDFETTGMLVCSKNILAHSYLSYLWEERNVSKNYICLCHKHFSVREGVIDKKISSDRHNNNKQVITRNGKDAKTEYKVLDEHNNVSRVDVKIIGGRKHQIRVHLSSINHPILGDKIYGFKDDAKRLMLEFYKVKFTHPRTLKEFEFECEKEF